MFLAIPPAAEGGVEEDIAAVVAVGEKGKGNEAATAAVRRLSDAEPQRLVSLFAAFNDANPIGRNLLGGVIQTIVNEAKLEDGSGAVLMVVVEASSVDGRFHPDAVALAFRILQERAPEMAASIAKSDGLRSSSPVVRRAGVAAKLEELSGDAPSADLRALLIRTLDRDQVEEIADRLAELDDPVDLPRHFGFLTDWQLAGPFDHREDQAFDAVLPPEETPATFDPEALFFTGFPEAGPTVGWRAISSDDDYGVVSVAESFENWKGSAVVLTRGFQAQAAGPATFRLGTPNAFKLYLNGDLVFAREEYHRGTKMDQYVIPAELNAGENVLTVKLLQNQQEQGWAQDYQVQFRVTDPTGAALREPVPEPKGDE